MVKYSYVYKHSNALLGQNACLVVLFLLFVIYFEVITFKNFDLKLDYISLT